MKRALLTAILMTMAAVVRAAAPPAAPADEAVMMKPFVIKAAEVFVRIKWLTDRSTRTPRVLLMQVSSLDERSAAYAAGLRVNMVIDAIDGRRVEDKTHDELVKIMNRPPRKDGFVEMTVLEGLNKRKIRFPVDDAVEAKK